MKITRTESFVSNLSGSCPTSCFFTSYKKVPTCCIYPPSLLHLPQYSPMATTTSRNHSHECHIAFLVAKVMDSLQLFYFLTFHWHLKLNYLYLLKILFTHGFHALSSDSYFFGPSLTFMISVYDRKSPNAYRIKIQSKCFQHPNKICIVQGDQLAT